MKILVAGWDRGGGVEAVQTVVRRAVQRGQQVRVLGTEGLRARFESAGAGFRAYRYAPDNDCRRPETDLVKEWEARTPLGVFARVRDRVMFGPARKFCRDVAEELRREAADVVVVDTLIPSALSAAEAAGVPSVLLMHGPYMLPHDGAPPLGTGWPPVRALMTTGPAVDPAVICAARHVTVQRWARHADVLPHCSAVVTHGGHGTVMKALAAGVPLVVVPLGRDQPDNAARVVQAGAGLRVRKNASAGTLREAIGRVLDDDRYRAAAGRMAAQLARERDEGLVVDELERVAARPPEDVSGAAQRALLQHSRLLAGRAPTGARPAW
jgi:UDP:flavonoid glycosyltransferase YjiC (YdhE family)